MGRGIPVAWLGASNVARQGLQSSEAGWPLCVSGVGCSERALREGPSGSGAPTGWRRGLSSLWQPLALVQP